MSSDGLPRKRCEQCRRKYSLDGDPRFCCEACREEASSSASRPDDVEALLTYYYDEKGHDLKETVRRQRAHLGFKNALTTQEVRDVLVARGIFNENLSSKLEDLNPEDLGLESSRETDDSWTQYDSPDRVRTDGGER